MIMEKFGRRQLLKTSCTGMALFSVCMAIASYFSLSTYVKILALYVLSQSHHDVHLFFVIDAATSVCSRWVLAPYLGSYVVRYFRLISALWPYLWLLFSTGHAVSLSLFLSTWLFRPWASMACSCFTPLCALWALFSCLSWYQRRADYHLRKYSKCGDLQRENL